jgi:hypothetical protein
MGIFSDNGPQQGCLALKEARTAVRRGVYRGAVYGAAAGAAAAGAYGYYGSYYNNGCYQDAYGNTVCPQQYPY